MWLLMLCVLCWCFVCFVALVHELFLVAALDDIDEDQGGDDEVEGAFAHVLNWVAPEAEMGELATFGEQEDANDEEDEKSEHFVEAVFLEEAGYGIGERDHHAAANDNGSDHDPCDLGDGHGAEDGVEGKDDIHHHNESDGFGHGRFVFGVFMRVIQGDHVSDFLDGCVDNECSTKEGDGGGEVHFHVQNVVVDAEPG